MHWVGRRDDACLSKSSIPDAWRLLYPENMLHVGVKCAHNRRWIQLCLIELRIIFKSLAANIDGGRHRPINERPLPWLGLPAHDRKPSLPASLRFVPSYRPRRRTRPDIHLFNINRQFFILMMAMLALALILLNSFLLQNLRCIVLVMLIKEHIQLMPMLPRHRIVKRQVITKHSCILNVLLAPFIALNFRRLLP